MNNDKIQELKRLAEGCAIVDADTSISVLELIALAERATEAATPAPTVTEAGNPASPAAAAPTIPTWQERCAWVSDAPATLLMVQAMKQEIADLRARLASAGAGSEDTARLDFMIQHEAWIAWDRDGESCRVFVDDLDSRRPFVGWVPEAYADDPRKAIDAAAALARTTNEGKQNG